MSKTPTPEAKLLGDALAKMGIEFQYERKFYKKHVDIAIRNTPLIIEVDGPPHNRTKQIGRDFVRDVFSKIHGYQTVRVSNEEVRRNPGTVASFVQSEILRIKEIL